MKNNTNLEVIRIDSIEDVATYFVYIEDVKGYGLFEFRNGFFIFRDQSYTGTVEITKNGAIALGKNWYGLFEGTKVSRVIANNTSNVTNMRGMFWGSKATSIDLSNFDTSNVTDMSYMFYGSRATSLDLSNFDTSNVTNMRGMFWGSKSPSIDLSSFDTSNVTDMSYMFWGSKATSIDLSNFDTSNVRNMSGMFCDSNVTSIDLRSFDISNVIDMDQIFDDSNIKEILVSTEDDANIFQGSSDMTLNLVFNPNKFNKKDITVKSQGTETIDKLVGLVLKNVREEKINIDDGVEMLKHLFRKTV